MKYPLLLAQFICIASLLRPGNKCRYPMLAWLLVVSIVATALFQTDVPWLNAWYIALAGPVLITRFVAALEISGRQTHHLPYWSRLIGGCFLLATVFTCYVWSMNELADGLQTFVQIRRYVQIWCATLFVLLETCWLTQNQWRGRVEDWVAVCFGVLLFNHGAVSLASTVHRWELLSWWNSAPVSWGLDTACWLVIAAIFRLGPNGLQSR